MCATLLYKFQLSYRYPELMSLSPVLYLDSSMLYMDSPCLLCGPEIASKQKARAVIGLTSFVSLLRITVLHCLLSNVVLYILFNFLAGKSKFVPLTLPWPEMEVVWFF